MKPQPPTADPLIRRLMRIRRRLRLLLAAHAACRLIVAGVALALLIIALDWWVHFPSGVRLVLLAFLCGWGLNFGRRNLWRPLTIPIGLDELALSLRSLPADVRDRAASVVGYLQSGGSGSARLWQELVRGAEESFRHERLPSGLTARRPLSWLAAAVVVLGSVGGGASMSPRFAGVAWRRLVQPLGPEQWPRRTEIAPLTGDAVAAFGESFMAEMRLARGDDEDRRAFLHWQGPDGRWSEGMMRRDADGVYRRLIENLRGDTRYFFASGDDDTSGAAALVRVVRRPSVASARLRITPPAYAGRTTAEVAFEDGRATAVAGSRLELLVTASRAVASGGGAEGSRVVFEDGRVIGLRPVGKGGDHLAAAFDADASTGLDVVLVDRAGWESRGGQRYRIEVTPDAPASVAVLEPPATLEVLSTAKVLVRVAARDDIGVESLQLMAGGKNGAFTQVADLMEQPAGGRTGPRPAIDVDFEWRLAGMKLTAGEVVEYFAEASDGFRLGEQRHAPARSTTCRLLVVSESQLGERLASEVLSVGEQLRGLLSGLQATLEQTRQLRRPADRARKGPPPPDWTETFQALVEELGRLRAGGQETARRLEEVVRRAEMNELKNADSARQADAMARRLSRILAGSVDRAAQSLARAADAARPADQERQLAASVGSQEEATRAVRELLDGISRWNSFAELVRRLQDILDRQESILRRVGGLLQAEAAGIDAAARAKSTAEQVGLEKDLCRLLECAEQMAPRLPGADRPAREALERAIRIGRDRGGAQQMAEAAEALRGGRLRAAARSQEAAASVVRAMIAALAEKPERELAELSREAQDARQRLERLIAAQRDLIERNRAAQVFPSPEVPLALLAERQASLEVSTRALEDGLRLPGSPGEDVRQGLGEAAEHMSSAAGLLKSASGAAAEEAQAAAVASLEAALELLQRIEEKAGQELAERSLAAIVATLVEIRDRQKNVRAETAQVDERTREAGRLQRADMIRLNRLGRDQATLVTDLSAVGRKLERSVVYAHVCVAAGARMESARGHLVARRAAEALAEQDLVLRSLNRLIDCVEETAQPTDAQFVDTEGAGAPGEPPTAARPIPTLAELKLLRLMQVDVNEQTVSMHRSLPDEWRRTEDQMGRIDALGVQQREIHDLAVKMIEKAESGRGD
jgi:hypothetical protein